MLKTTAQKIILCTALLFTNKLRIAEALTHPLDFKIHNRTSQTISRLYISDSRTRKWQGDILGGQRVSPGNYASIHFFGPENWCVYNLKVVFADGDGQEEYKEVDLCEINDFYVDF